MLESNDALGGAAHQLPAMRLLLLAWGMLLLSRLAGRLEGAVLDVTLQGGYNLRMPMT